MTVLTHAAFMKAKPGQGEELGRALLALVAPTRTEPGCLRYEIHRALDDPATWSVYEDWRSRADFDAHMATSYVGAFMARVPDLCDGPVEIRAFQRLSEPFA